MLTLFGDPAVWLPLVFAGLMGLAILIYVVLDGYDLGVGLLFAAADPADKDRMIAAIGPFWDANETWLVLAVGLLLVAFPAAHGLILTALYLPVLVMLIGLILRGVAFEFRAKVKPAQKGWWNGAFFAGSLMTALSQGWMLGFYVMGLNDTPATYGFAALTAVCLAASYAFIGATWLMYKTEGALQRQAVRWARVGLGFLVLGLAAVSVASPWVSARIFEKWFSLPNFILLAPLPLGCAALITGVWIVLRHLPTGSDRFAWVPFAGAVGIYTLAFFGLAYSFFPYVVPEKLTIFAAASAPESLMIMLVGALFVLPAIIGYSAFAYFVFRGKATELRYD
ncbi:cytochrome d ubiquinol oxidase subunit II [Elstera cyanobacteriorum]|uniref:cytochrome d ubiquinol oxidase subunit II n=1 Tax=Elstera cyanobacteriorum TaxID=2022747 RepID=UPI00235628F8|nr:cytochrome d ubiquinol oxidase subunit II [Elstera cyanobacteriorum]MCK6443691.1 cytochrome d ubiquinol oxidase subunit II [Elstera cyanobacteriorum]